MRVTFRGDIAALKAALEARGYTVQQGGNTLRISR
jgi:microcompartment protein CcmL/EutN